MSKLDDILRHMVTLQAVDELRDRREIDRFGEAKRQIKVLMLEVFKSCEHDGSFVSVGAFEKKVNEL